MECGKMTICEACDDESDICYRCAKVETATGIRDWTLREKALGRLSKDALEVLERLAEDLE